MSEGDLTGNLLYGFGSDSNVGINVEPTVARNSWGNFDRSDYEKSIAEKYPCLTAVGPERTYFVLPMPNTDNVNWFRIPSFLNKYCTNNAPGVAMMEDKFKAYTDVDQFNVPGNNGCFVCSQNSKVYTNKVEFVEEIKQYLDGDNVVCVQST